MDIRDLTHGDERGVQQAAEMLVAAFADLAPEAWPDLPSALAEVQDMLAPERICRCARDRDGNVLGWIGGIPQYDGHVWELHPLVVRPDRQRQGIGRALVADLEGLVRARGGLTIMLGSDDERNRTTLGGVELYDAPWRHIRDIRDLGGHPLVFYQKMGYTVVGFVPDANGWGRPDILLAKRVGKTGTPTADSSS